MITAIANEDGTVALVGKQGTTWDISLTLFQDEAGTVPFDLTLYLARGEYRKDYKTTSLPLLAFTCTPDLGGDANVLKITATAALTAGLAILSGVYDIEVYNQDESSVERVLEGKLTVSQEVTK
jgi:hypothetical protein